MLTGVPENIAARVATGLRWKKRPLRVTGCREDGLPATDGLPLTADAPLQRGEMAKSAMADVPEACVDYCQFGCLFDKNAAMPSLKFAVPASSTSASSSSARPSSNPIPPPKVMVLRIAASASLGLRDSISA